MRTSFLILSLFISNLINSSNLAQAQTSWSYQGQEIQSDVLDVVNYAAQLTSNGSHYCSGFFVSSTRVLTAAHCIKNRNSQIMIYPLFWKKGERGLVGKVSSASNHDIAVIELDSPHALLNDDAFKKIKISQRLDRSHHFYIVGSSGVLPLINECVNPGYASDYAIICANSANEGQSGSALVGLGWDKDGKTTINVHGVLSSYFTQSHRSLVVPIGAL